MKKLALQYYYSYLALATSFINFNLLDLIPGAQEQVDHKVSEAASPSHDEISGSKLL